MKRDSVLRILEAPGARHLQRLLSRIPGYAVASRLFRQLSVGRGRLLSSPSGYQLWVDADTYGAAMSYIRTPHEPVMTRIMRSLLAPGDRFVDVGCNVGHFTLVAASIVGPTGKVLSFEPDPRSLRVLEKTLRRLAIHNIDARHTAVADFSGHAVLNLSQHCGHSGLSSSSCRPGSLVRSQVQTVAISSTRVPVTTLDRECEHQRIAGIKIDAEGAEPAVIRGAHSVLSDNPDLWVLTEVPGDGATSLVQQLRSLGFALWDIDERDATMTPIPDSQLEKPLHGWNILATRGRASETARLVAAEFA